MDRVNHLVLDLVTMKKYDFEDYFKNYLKVANMNFSSSLNFSNRKGGGLSNSGNTGEEKYRLSPQKMYVSICIIICFFWFLFSDFGFTKHFKIFFGNYFEHDLFIYTVSMHEHARVTNFV